VSFYTTFLRPFLFKTDPEQIHYRVFGWLTSLFRIPGVRVICKWIYCSNDKRLKRTVFGVEFPNPVGLAAGLDKDAKMFNELSALGFGFIEVGTVTPVAQPGNDKPRLFRLPADEALINRMGFNNEGVDAMAERLSNHDRGIIIGGNIGKNKNTPNENAVVDYEKLLPAAFSACRLFRSECQLSKHIRTSFATGQRTASSDPQSLANNQSGTFFK
jgi:dihydroorotate dehydrogenase